MIHKSLVIKNKSSSNHYPNTAHPKSSGEAGGAAGGPPSWFQVDFGGYV